MNPNLINSATEFNFPVVLVEAEAKTLEALDKKFTVCFDLADLKKKVLRFIEPTQILSEGWKDRFIKYYEIAVQSPHSKIYTDQNGIATSL